MGNRWDNNYNAKAIDEYIPEATFCLKMMFRLKVDYIKVKNKDVFIKKCSNRINLIFLKLFMESELRLLDKQYIDINILHQAKARAIASFCNKVLSHIKAMDNDDKDFIADFGKFLANYNFGFLQFLEMWVGTDKEYCIYLSLCEIGNYMPHIITKPLNCVCTKDGKWIFSNKYTEDDMLLLNFIDDICSSPYFL